jgi:hypothetical protein
MFAMPEQITILRRMKGMKLFLGCVVTLVLLGACSVAQQDAADVGQQFQDGIQGRGRIIPNDPTRDSFGPEYQ